MKILLFVDTHDKKNVLKGLREQAKTCDLCVCAGDFTIFGNNQYNILEELNGFGTSLFLIHGNHEREDEVRELATDFDNITFFHNEFTSYEDIGLIGHGGGGFTPRYDDFEEKKTLFGERMNEYETNLLVTHAPPFNTKLDERSPGDHVGSVSYRDFIETYQPNLSVSGHIHQTAGEKDMIGDTTLINPGWDGYMVDL